MSRHPRTAAGQKVVVMYPALYAAVLAIEDEALDAGQLARVMRTLVVDDGHDWAFTRGGIDDFAALVAAELKQ